MKIKLKEFVKKLTFHQKIKIFIFFFSGIIIVPISTLFLGLILASSGFFDSPDSPMPTFEVLENPPTNLATEIISSDGVVIGTYFLENRRKVRYDEISKHTIDALIATEDERFYKHSGIDYKSTLRAIIFMGSRGGGSTLTQQLAKMLFSKRPKSKIQRVTQKLREWVIATRLEQRYTKDEIITMYLNKFDFLNQAIGINTAARIYFNKEAISLNVEESAMLVGMAKNPSLYNPLRYPKKCLERRNVVLNQMQRNKDKLGIMFSPEEFDSLKKIPLLIEFKKASHNEGIATYFREHLRAYMKDWIKNNPKPDGSYYNLYTDGLKIYTTIDSRIQNHAENAVSTHMKKLQADFFSGWQKHKSKKAPFDKSLTSRQIERIYKNTIKRTERYRVLKDNNISDEKIEKIFNNPVSMKLFSWEKEIDTILSPMDSIKYYKYFLNSGLLSIDPGNGHVKAWVGGINHKYFKYDNVNSKRQVGSTFKPFVYATAIDLFKYSPCLKVPNSQVVFEKDEYGLKEDYMPRNANKKYGGEFTLMNGLAQSKNSITAFLMKKVQPKNVVRLGKKLGFSNLKPIPSLCLGSVEIPLYQMTSSYTMFANSGVQVKPVFLKKIEDKNGIIIYNQKPEYKDILSEEINYVMLKLLQGVVDKGTALRLRGSKNKNKNSKGDNYQTLNNIGYEFTNQIAGKTGTTDNHSDGWFIGLVPDLVTGVWVGGEERSIHFRSIKLGSGANMALPIWGEFMKNIYNDSEFSDNYNHSFDKPNKALSINLDCKIENNDNSNIFDESFD